MFGSSTTQNQPTGSGTGSGLFGSSANTQPQSQHSSGGLFGSGQPAQGQSGNFGASNSLFGGASDQQQTNPSTSLFSNAMNNSNNTANLFKPAGSLFQPSASTAPQQTHLSSSLQAGLNKYPASTMMTSNQNDLVRSRLNASSISTIPNTKSVPAQIQTLFQKYDPASPSTALRTYLYNAVSTPYAPFYHANPDEDPQEWERALSDKPASIENDTISFVPVLVRGFHALGQRAEFQAQTLTAMRTRLHEMNNSLDAVMSKHQQNLTVRIENARRQHTALSQRYLRLAVKAQSLRNRGLPLTSEEESLRLTLLDLESRVFDPALTGREEEIWARMVALRERGKWLSQETQRFEQKSAPKESAGLPEHVIQKTKSILRDYDGQIRHLGKELEEVKKEFEEAQKR